MIYRELGKTGMKISAVSYAGIVSMVDGQDNSDAYVEYAIKNGINYFDVAPTYGDSEEKLGNSLIPYRKDIYLACKTNIREAEGAKRDIDRSFELLHTDYFDNYQLHGITTVEEVETIFSKGGAFEPILKAKEEGLFHHLGMTCHTEEAALRALELYDFETVLFPINWGLNMYRGFGNKIIQTAKEREMGILAMKAFIHRAWNDDLEKLKSGFHKSWCKPIINDDEFLMAAMRYSLSLGADTLIPPGNFHHFSFAVDHIDEVLAHPYSEKDEAILKKHLPEVEGHEFL